MDYLYANIDADIIDSGEVKFKSVDATVDEFVGTPSVDLSLEDDNLVFHFHNLKGNQGVQGPVGNGIASVTINSSYGLVFTLDNGTQLDPTSSVRGPAGPGLGPDGSLPWSKVVDTPVSYTPSAHTHTMSEVEGLPLEILSINSVLDTKASIESLNTKQDTLIAGKNITISGNTISASTDKAVTDELDVINSSIVNINEGINLIEASLTTAVGRLTEDESNISTNATNIASLTVTVNTLENNLTDLTGSVGALTENKVDKVSGKSLISNDELNRLSTVQSRAQVNIIESIKLNGATVAVEGKEVDLGNLVEVEEGKGLSSNDFNDELKNKLTGIESGAQVNLDPEIIVNGVTYTPTISGQTWSINLDTIATSDVVENIDGRVTTLEENWPGNEGGLKTWVTTQLDPITATISTITGELSGKVDKDGAKMLSTNDFTDEDANKLDGIESEAQVNIIESIKLNGATVTVENKEADLGYLVTGIHLNGEDYNPTGETPVLSLGYLVKSDILRNVANTVTVDNNDDVPSIGAVKDYLAGELNPIRDQLDTINRVLGGL